MKTGDARRWEKAAGVAFATMVGGRLLGAAISPLLFAHLPILLIVMSPFLIHLVFVAPLVEPVFYFPVALVVTTGQAMVGFFFGSTLGARALDWLLQRVPLPLALAQKLLGLVRRLSIIAVFAIPGPVMGTIAGVAGVRRSIFLSLALPAQAIWVTAAYFVGEALLDYIALARAFVTDHAFGLTALTLFIGVLRYGYGQFKSRYRKPLPGDFPDDTDKSARQINS